MKHARNAFGKFDIYDIGKRALSLMLCIAMLLGMSWYVAEETEVEGAQASATGQAWYWAGATQLKKLFNSATKSAGFGSYSYTTDSKFVRLNCDSSTTDRNIYIYPYTDGANNMTGNGFNRIIIVYKSNYGSGNNGAYVASTNGGFSQNYFYTGNNMYGNGSLGYIQIDVGGYGANNLRYVRLDLMNESGANGKYIDIYGIAFVQTGYSLNEAVSAIVNTSGINWTFDFRVNCDNSWTQGFGPYQWSNPKGGWKVDYNDGWKDIYLGVTNGGANNNKLVKTTTEFSLADYQIRGTASLSYMFYATQSYHTPTGTKFITSTTVSDGPNTTKDYGQAGAFNYVAGDNYIEATTTMHILFPNTTREFYVEPVWTANTYTITWKDDNGTTLGTSPVTYGTVPSRSGPTKAATAQYTYTFSHWTPTPVAAVANATYTAVYSKTTNQYTLTIKPNGGTWDNKTTDSTVKKDYNATYTPADPAKTGYNFTGWTHSGNGSYNKNNKTFTYTGNGTLTANWAAKEYNVTLNYNYTGAPTATTLSNPKVTFDSGNHHTVTPPTRDGYTFKGYYTAASGGTKVWDANGNAVKGDYWTAAGTSGKWKYNGGGTFYAQWKAITYTITYDGNGATDGSTAQSSHTYDADKALTTNAFTRTGYKFLGWSTDKAATAATYTDGQAVKNLASTQDANVTLYAIWELDQVTVTFDANGGECDTQTGTYNIGQAYGSLPSATRDGYAFLGWYNAAEGGSKIESTTVMNSTTAHTLYAHWAIEYNVSWVAYSADTKTIREIRNETHTLASIPAHPSIDSRPGYDFTGWDCVQDDTNYTVVYTAQYHAITYTITLDLNNGTIDGSDTTITYTIEDEVTLPLPTRQFHSFNRWDVKSTTGNWLEVADGNDYEENKVYTGMYGDVTLEARWRDRDIPVNIYTDGDGGVNIYVNGELYKVIDRGEKGLLYTDKFANGDKITLEAVPFVGTEPDEDKFVLSNWHEGDSINGAEVESEGNKYTFTTKTEDKETGYSYHAEFTPFRYTIHFDGNGATEGTTADATGKWRRKTTLPENGFIRPGYEFKGWCLDKDGSGTIYAPGDYEVDEDGNGKWLNLCDVHGGTVILYAKWTIREYYITFDTNGGDSIDEDNKIEFTIDSDYKLPLPVREGYTFVKWNLIPNTDKNSSGEILSNGIWDVVTDPFYAGYEINGLYGWATLRAEWTPHTYTVEFDLNGCDGTPPEAGTYTTDDTLVLPSHASNGIFAFRGWSTEKNYSTSDVLLPSGNYSAFNIMDGVNIADGGRITLYAVWELTIVYDPDYGSMQPVTKQYYYSADHKATEGQEGGGLRIRMEEISPREGYKPHKWSLSSDDSTGKGTFTAGETYKFTPMMDSDGAGTIYNNIITNKHVLRLYTIWYKEVRVVFDANAGSDAVTNMPTDDIVVSIAGDMFDANVGNPEFELKHIQTITLPNNYPEREGYAFLGWHKNSESSARQVSPGGTYDTLFTMGDYDSENNRFVLYAIWNKSHDVIACYDPADGYETYLNDAWGFFGQHANKWWSQPYFSGFDQNDMFETDSRFYQGGYLSFKLDGSQKYMQAIFGLDSYTVKTTTRVVIAYRVRGLNGEYNMSIGKTFAYQDAYNDEAKAICDGNIHYVVFEVDSKYADQALDRFSLRFTSADDSIIPAGATLDIFSVGYCEGDKSAEFFGKRAVSDAVLALNDYNYTVTYEFADTGDYSGKFYTDEGKTVTDTKTFTFSTGHGETLGWRKAVPLAIETSLYWDNDIPARKGYEFIDWKGSGSEGAYTAGVQTVEGKPLYALSGHLGTEGVYDPTLYLWQHGAMPEGGFTFTIKVNWKALFGSLTLTRPEGLDPGQDFIFTIKGKETDENTKDVNVTVVSHDFADPATDVVVIDALPVGDYTITEWDHWSWRYTKVTVTTDNDSGEVNIQPEGKSVTYNVGAASAKVVQWLSDDCYGRYKDENDYEPEATD